MDQIRVLLRVSEVVMAGTISATTAVLISAGVAAAGTAATLGYEMSQSGPSATTTQEAAEEKAKASSAASLAQAEALTKRRGMASTQLTSPMGISGTASVGKATLG